MYVMYLFISFNSSIYDQYLHLFFGGNRTIYGSKSEKIFILYIQYSESTLQLIVKLNGFCKNNGRNAVFKILL